MPGQKLAEAFVEVSLDRRKLDTGMDATRAAFKSTMESMAQDAEQKVQRFTQSTTAKASRLAQAFTQAGYGVQDFAVQFGNMGLGGALNASVNNFAQVAQILGGPVTGTITALAATLTSVGISSWLAYSNSQEKTTESTSRLSEALSRQHQVLEKMAGLRAANTSTVFGSAIPSALASEQANLVELTKKRDDLNRSIEATKRQFPAGETFELTAGERKMMFPTATEMEGLSDREKKRRELQSELDRRAFAEARGGRITTLLPSGEAMVTGGSGSPKELAALNDALKRDTEAKEANDTAMEASATKIKRLLADQNEERKRAAALMRNETFLYEENANKAAALSMELDKQIKSTLELSKSGMITPAERDQTLAMLRTSHKEKLSALNESELDAVFREGDEANRKFIARREARERDDAAAKKREADQQANLLKFQRALRDDLEPAFTPFAKIVEELDARKEEIAKFTLPDERKAELTASAQRAAELQLEGLRPRSPTSRAAFSGIADFERNQTLSMLGSDESTALKDTAKYSKMSLDELQKINAKKGTPAVYSD